MKSNRNSKIQTKQKTKIKKNRFDVQIKSDNFIIHFFIFLNQIIEIVQPAIGLCDVKFLVQRSIQYSNGPKTISN